MLKPFLGFGQPLGFQVGNAKKIGRFEILIQRDGSLQIADGCVKISAIKLDAAKHILRARVTRVAGDDGLSELAGFLDVTGAERSDCGINRNVGIARGKLERFVKFTRSFLKAGFGNGKISELSKAESDGLIVVTFGSG